METMALYRRPFGQHAKILMRLHHVEHLLNKTHNKRWLVPDLSDALKQRIQREAFLCNELTIREEDLSKDNEEDEGDIEQEEII